MWLTDLVSLVCQASDAAQSNRQPLRRVRRPPGQPSCPSTRLLSERTRMIPTRSIQAHPPLHDPSDTSGRPRRRGPGRADPWRRPRPTGPGSPGHRQAAERLTTLGDPYPSPTTPDTALSRTADRATTLRTRAATTVGGSTRTEQPYQPACTANRPTCPSYSDRRS